LPARDCLAPSVELAGIAVIAEYRGHALGAADVADRRGVPPDVIQRVLHRQLRVGLEDLRLGATVIPHQVRPDEFVVEPLESKAEDPNSSPSVSLSAERIYLYKDDSVSRETVFRDERNLGNQLITDRGSYRGN